jgi:hypothetical protein
MKVSIKKKFNFHSEVFEVETIESKACRVFLFDNPVDFAAWVSELKDESLSNKSAVKLICGGFVDNAAFVAFNNGDWKIVSIDTTGCLGHEFIIN